MCEKKSNVYFDKFIIKMNKINPNLKFDESDWVPGIKKIKGYCTTHNIEFLMQRTTNCLLYNCPECISGKKFNKKEKEEVKKLSYDIDDSVKLVKKEKTFEDYNNRKKQYIHDKELTNALVH